jgi:hypothetical protein
MYAGMCMSSLKLEYTSMYFVQKRQSVQVTVQGPDFTVQKYRKFHFLFLCVGHTHYRSFSWICMSKYQVNRYMRDLFQHYVKPWNTIFEIFWKSGPGRPMFSWLFLQQAHSKLSSHFFVRSRVLCHSVDLDFMIFITDNTMCDHYKFW